MRTVILSQSEVATHLQIVTRLRMSAAMPLLSLYVLMAWTQAPLLF
jgi:hypothetical protein